jgi:hypothetical protein
MLCVTEDTVVYTRLGREEKPSPRIESHRAVACLELGGCGENAGEEAGRLFAQTDSMDCLAHSAEERFLLCCCRGCGS